MDERKFNRQRLGKTFKGLRIKKGFNQKAFAKYAGIDRSYYSKIEKGTVEISLNIFRRISKGLGFRLSRLARVIERILD